MTPSLISTGNNPRLSAQPYVLAVASHKGGTGRTTAALALAWCWGQAGLRTFLVDADPVPAARLVAAGPNGQCPWMGVRLLRSLPGPGDRRVPGELIVVDCPPLTEPDAQRVLQQADGVLLVTQAELLALRTTPTATRALHAARADNPALALVGLLVAAFDEGDAFQSELLSELRSLPGMLLFDPPVPRRPELRDWPLNPGSDLPAGPGRRAYLDIASRLAERVGVAVGS